MSGTPPDPATLAERVRLFVAETTGGRLDRVGLESRLAEDLGVDGVDAADLLDAFAERFGVDLSEMQVDRHVAPEGLPFSAGVALFVGAAGLMLLWAWAWWAALLGLALAVAVWKQQPPNPSALRVRHLVTAAELGRWDTGAMSLPETVD